MPSDPFQVKEVEQTAAKFAARHIEPVAMEADHAEARFPGEVFARGVEAGFDRFLLPEEAGGYGFHMAELCALVRTLAGTCAGHAMVFGVHAAAVKSLFDVGGPDRTDLLERVLDSSLPVGIAMPDTLTFRDFETGLTASQGKREDSYQLSGKVGLAVNAERSGWFVAFARTSEGAPLSLLLQGGDGTIMPGGPEQTLGLRAMPVAELNVDGDVATRSRIIAEGDLAARLYSSLVHNLCMVTAAAAAGLMRSAFTKALAYAGERYQGGRMIIDHSHLRSIMGEMSAAVTASEGALFHASSRPAGPLAVLGTKVSVTECAVKTCTDAVQILGGYGYMRDFGLEKAMRDAATLALLPVSNVRAELLIAELEKEKLG